MLPIQYSSNMKKQLLKILLFSFLLLFQSFILSAQTRLDSILPIRGFCIGAPAPAEVDAFVKFINEELKPRKVNTLILRVTRWRS